MVFKPTDLENIVKELFENDVKEYGIQTKIKRSYWAAGFENDVKEYGIQTGARSADGKRRFENDVKEYGIQTNKATNKGTLLFENDVKEYSVKYKYINDVSIFIRKEPQCLTHTPLIPP